jgi:predicted ATPase
MSKASFFPEMLEHYQKLVMEGALRRNESQIHAIARMQRLIDQIATQNPGVETGFLFGKRKRLNQLACIFGVMLVAAKQCY